jgi:MYXO-CTERM domain-containing protein
MARAPAAFAFVQYQIVDTGVPTGVFFHWTRSCIPIITYPNDLPEMTPAEIEQAASAAAAAWSRDMLSCTFLDLKVTASLGATRAAASDAYNVLVFRNPWCDPAHPELCQPEALAVTSVWAGKTSGVIHDGDIEVNSQNFVWADLVAHPANGTQDLQNALTHEMGHLIGLDHNCYTPSVDPIHQKDQNGQLVPLCLGAPADVQAATMYTKADFGDLSKRSLEPDDQAAACDIYPAAADPGCPGPSSAGCGCTVEPGSGPPAAVLLAASLLASVGRRRRGQRSSREEH